MDQKTIAMAATAAKTLWPARPTQWTREDVKLFERALVEVRKNSLNRWEKIAEKVPSKSVAEVKDHYEELVRDISDIEPGRVELPNYPDDDLPMSSGIGMPRQGDEEEKKKMKKKKGIPWSEQEHNNLAPVVPIDQNCVPLPGGVGSLHQSQVMDYFPSSSRMQDQMGSQMHY
ncbi:hypothetical protein TSUD_50920 [Trifolium subterraneum]|uniref:Uncharacterized protein n=1 Tax=Trifolium subterraneum TaxID=3900 RepID=A0A2Z6M768_TRISU|nr:hypothetical protein TSUD_50920 [Trifolium subterraneum]